MSNIDKQALVIPQRERHDWSQAVMRNCDFCQQWALTVRHSDGGCICASCCDSEYTTALSSALVVVLDELEAAEKRIAEQREYYEGVIADGSRRIAELEAREINLPPYSFFDFKQGSPFKNGAYCHLDAVNAELAKHGIKIVTAAGIGKGGNEHG